MKADWKTVKLGDIALVGAGNSAPQDDADFSTDGPYFVRTSDVGEVKFGKVNSSNDRLSSKGAKGMRLWKAGTILIPKSGASTFVNHRVILGLDAHVSSHLATIQAEPTRCDARYLLYYLSTVKAQDLIQDQSYPSLKLPEIAGIEIPLPPLAEQKRIVALLDEAFAGIDEAKAKAEVNRKNAQALLESHIQAIFTNRGPDWEEKKISDLSDHITVGFVGSMAHLFVEKGIPLLRGQNIRKYGIQFDNLKYISKETHAKWGKSALIPGDVAIVRVGYPGTAAVVPEGSPELNAASLVIVRPSPRLLDSYFLSHALNSEWGKSVIKARSVGAAQQVFNTGTAANLEIPLPTLIEQKQIVKRLDELSDETQRLAKAYTNKYTELVNLKSALLTQAFAGELTA